MSTPRRALIVIDVQNEYFTGKLGISYPDPAITLPNVGRAMDAAVAAGIPVVVVQHITPPGTPIFAEGSHGAALHPSIAERPRDHLISKQLASAFTGTGLADWLRSRGMAASRRDLKLTARGRWAWLLDQLSPARASWNGHNASCWTRDAIAINGFDERMQYGGQDREFGERLENAGIRGKRIRYRAVVVHLDHSRGYARPESIAKNRAIRAQTRRERITWTPHGITKSPAPGVPAGGAQA